MVPTSTQPTVYCTVVGERADRSSCLTALSFLRSSCRSAHFLLSFLDCCTRAVDPPVLAAFHGRILLAWPAVDSVGLPLMGAVELEAAVSDSAMLRCLNDVVGQSKREISIFLLTTDCKLPTTLQTVSSFR